MVTLAISFLRGRKGAVSTGGMSSWRHPLEDTAGILLSILPAACQEIHFTTHSTFFLKVFNMSLEKTSQKWLWQCCQERWEFIGWPSRFLSCPPFPAQHLESCMEEELIHSLNSSIFSPGLTCCWWSYSRSGASGLGGPSPAAEHRFVIRLILYVFNIL